MSEQMQAMKALVAEAASPASGFDVAKLVVDGREALWSRDQFKALSLLERVRMLTSGQLRFFRKGMEVKAREALRDL